VFFHNHAESQMINGLLGTKHLFAPRFSAVRQSLHWALHTSDCREVPDSSSAQSECPHCHPLPINIMSPHQRITEGFGIHLLAETDSAWYMYC